MTAPMIIGYQFFGSVHRLVEMVKHLLTLSRSDQYVLVGITLTYTQFVQIFSNELATNLRHYLFQQLQGDAIRSVHIDVLDEHGL